MTSLPEDGERRPMALLQDSDDPPACGRGRVSAVPQLFLWQKRMLVHVTIYLYTMCPHHSGARIRDAGVMPLCFLTSSDGLRCTISLKPFASPYQLVFRCEHCLTLAQSPHGLGVVLVFP